MAEASATATGNNLDVVNAEASKQQVMILTPAKENNG